MQCNNAILHKFAILAFVFAFGYLHCQSIIHESFQLAADATCFTLVAKAFIYILRCKQIRQTAISYPCHLLMCSTRSFFCFLIVVILLTDSQEEKLLKGKMGIDYE